MLSIKEITTEQLFDIAHISTGGYFKSEFASYQKEVETGGYGFRRKLEWVLDGEKNYFEISSEDNKRGWHWYAWCIDKQGVKHNVNCLNFPGVIDYCDQHNINVRNN